MASYKISIKRTAEKELRDIVNSDLKKVVQKIQALVKNPRGAVCEKLSGEEKYRIRQDGWRIVYAIDDKNQFVEIVKIGNRREVYR